MEKKYARAYTEVLEIINHFSNEEYSKIPKEKIDFFKKNMDKDYKFIIDPDIDLDKQNLSQETKAIIVTLFRDYFATEQQKEKLEIILQQNQDKKDQEKLEKYTPDNIFKKTTDKNEQSNTTNANLPIEIKKESFFEKFIKFIKSLFKQK